MAETSNALDRERLLNEAIVAYFEAVESGQAPDEEQWLARYPEIAPELAECLKDQQKIDGWIEPLRYAAHAASLAAGTVKWDVRGPSERSAELPDVPLADYELLEEIARGGMGVVYKARQVSLGRVVALKMIRAGQLASPAEVARFRAEAEAAASLDHPHIMPIYDVGDCQGRPYFSMKLFEGGSLAEHLPRFGDDQRSAAYLLAQVARAVHHAHQRGILHRDLKPANILLDRLWQPSVADFGLARSVQGDSGITQSGAIVGTPSYMAPEQAAGQKDLTTAVDVYSLGSILYTVLTGRPPFHTDTPLETVRQVLEEEPSRPRLLDPRVARDLETICLKCLKKQPEQRYGSAEALAEDLERWLAGEPIHARRSSAWERGWKKAKRNPWAAALVAVSALALIGSVVGGFLYQQQRARVAEQQLIEQRRLNQQWGFVAQAEVDLAEGDWQRARDALLLVREQVVDSSEPGVPALAERIDGLIAKANQGLTRLEARLQAERDFQQFFRHRDEVFFHGTLFTGIDLPANVEVTLREGKQALRLVGMTLEGEERLSLDSSLTAGEKSELANGCYELLLVLGEAFARQSPPRIEQAKRVVERAAQLRSPTKAYYLRHGRYLGLLGDPTGAEADYARARRLDSSSALDHFLVGEFFWQQRNVPAAIVEFENVLRRQPDHFWARYFLAVCRLSTDPEAAKAHLTACLDAHSERYGSYLHLLRGLAHAQLNELREAEDDFQKALELAPDDPSRRSDLLYAVLVNRGVLRERQRRYTQAVSDLTDAIDLKPVQFQAYWNLAKVYQRQERLDRATQELTKAIDVAESPGVATELELALLYHQRARLYWDREDRRAALEDVNAALDVKPLAESYVLLGRLLETQARYPAAAAAYTEAMQAAPADPRKYKSEEPILKLAEVQVVLGQYREAVDLLEQYLAEGVEPDGDVYRLLGLARAKDGDHTGAISDYTLALRLGPDDPRTHALRGWVYFVRNALDLALEDFERAIVLDPTNGDAYNGRGYVRVKRGDAAGAVVAADEALRRGPETPRMLWNAARIHAQAMSLAGGAERRRYHDRAVELLRRAVESTPPASRATFWRRHVQADADDRDGALTPLRESPEFRRMADEYAPRTNEAFEKEADSHEIEAPFGEAT